MSAKTPQTEEKDNSIIARDGNNESPWQSGVPKVAVTAKARAIGDIVYDAVIIGGGITGMTTALLLQEAGKQCVIAEAHSVGFGTTGGTSAHINTFADTTYKEAESAFGEDGARLFADAIMEGFSIIRDNVKARKISCDFEEKTGYVYAEDEQQVKELNDIYDGADDLEIDVRYTSNVPTSVAFLEAVEFPGQAQFHPLKYLKGLEKAYLKAGGILLENTKVDGVDKEEDIYIIKAGEQVIRARHAVYATHIPPGVNVFSLRCAPYRSYVLGVTLKDKNYPDALVYDMQEPYHYFRTHELDGAQVLIAGGNDHKTGHDDPEEAFASLEKYIRKHYKVAAVKYRWSSQYYVPVDGFPYIGQMPGSDHMYCATGYNGNGMMLGSVAGKILSDLIMGKGSKYEEIFRPGRMKPVAGFKEFIKENADVVHQFIASRFSAHEVDFLKRVRKDSGKVVEFEGRKIAVYRDAAGAIHALNPVCTHAKCIVNWNNEEKSWDCPCHGARFDINGKVLNGPADRPLDRIDIEGSEEA